MCVCVEITVQLLYVRHTGESKGWIKMRNHLEAQTMKASRRPVLGDSLLGKPVSAKLYSFSVFSGMTH